MITNSRYVILALATFVLVAAAFVPSSAAQSSSCIITGSGFWTPPPDAISCTYIGSIGLSDYVCTFWGNCAPPAAANETFCAACAAAAAGHPISLANGDTYIEENDVRLPGLGGGLALNRIWNSIWPPTQSSFRTGLFGPGWRSTFEERVFLGNDHVMKYSRGDGSYWSFYHAGTSWKCVAPQNVQATLVQGSSAWTLTFQNGENRLFDINSGDLISIVDRNGNATQVAYDAIGRMTSVTDPASRHLYFAYANDSSYLITSVTSDAGVSLTYTYDGQGRLTQVVKPDQSTLNFEYDANSFISAVKDSLGKILESHTYDSAGRGLTSSRANGVDAVTVSYPKQ